MPFSTKLNIPDILKGLPDEAFLVGGSVRDMLVGLHSKDHDVSVGGDPRPFAQLLAERTGGRVVVLGNGLNRLYRIVSRQWCIDLSRMKGEHISEDLGRRDFTINAMAGTLDTGHIIDPFGGMDDLRARRIRMIHPEGFNDDPLRLLRAYRMAACLGFNLDAPTAETIARKADLIQTVAGERIWNEIQQILIAADSHTQIAAMSQNGMLTSLFPEMAALTSCHWNQHHRMCAFDHSLAAFSALEKISAYPNQYLGTKGSNFMHRMNGDDLIILKFSILLHDIGKSATRSVDAANNVHYYGHAKHGAYMAKQIGRRLRLSSHHLHRLEFLIRRHQDPLMLYLACQREARITPRATARFFRKCSKTSPQVLIHALADEMGKHPSQDAELPNNQKLLFFRDLIEGYFSSVAPLQNKPKLLDGRDLMAAFDLPPSPFIGRLLNDIETARLAGEISSHKDAIEWVENRLKARGQPNRP